MIRPMNLNVLVCILKYPPEFTGAGQRIHRIYRHLKEKGVDRVYVIATTSRKFSYKKETIDDVQVHFIGNNRLMEQQKSFRGKLHKVIFVLSSLFKTFFIYLKLYRHFDVVHTIDSSWLSTFIAYLAFFTKKPLIKEIVLLGSDDPLTLKNKKFLKGFFLFPFKYASHIVVISDALKRACVLAGIPEEKVWSRPNPVYSFHSTKDDANDLTKEKRKAKRILWIGKINPRKNIEFLVESGRYLQGPAILTFIGPSNDFPEYFQKLKQMAEDIEDTTQDQIKFEFIEKNVPQSELGHFYKETDLFWFASHKEGMGNVVAESLVYGTPVITLPVDGIMEQLLKHPDDGEVVKTNSTREFAEVINRWLSRNDIHRAAISERAKIIFDPVAIENGYLTRLKSMV